MLHVSGRDDLPALLRVIQPPCDRLRSKMLAGRFSPVPPFNAQQLIFKGNQRYEVVTVTWLKYLAIQLMSAGLHTHTTAPC